MDPGPEPNENEVTDTPWRDIVGCDDPPDERIGVLDGAADIDWHLFLGAFPRGDCGLLHPNPSVKLTTDSNIRLCAFFSCDNGGVLVTCGEGTEPATSPAGRNGCCAHGDVSAVIECPSLEFEDTAAVYVRVDEAPPESCVSYQLAYKVAVP